MLHFVFGKRRWISPMPQSSHHCLRRHHNTDHEKLEDKPQRQHWTGSESIGPHAQHRACLITIASS